MQKLANQIVGKSKIILVIFILLALCSVWLMTQVNINTDMTKYLPDDSSTKQGLGIMDAEFPAATSLNLMFEGLNEDDKSKILDELSKTENVQSVIYEQENEKYNKDDYALYIVNIDFPADSTQTKTVVDTVSNQFSSYDITLGGDATGNSELNVLPKIAGFAFIILLIILFLMCNSWVEPFIFLVTIAVAILINMGTNAIFNSVSETTNSIAAILQLCLSIDYSIMLINRYRQEKQSTEDKNIAMKKALQNAFKSISSSSITTIVGILALVFMSFTIGKDMGLVLAKGVFLSLICIFTVLPALILMFDKLIEKTAKKSIHLKMDKVASFSYSARYVLVAVFLILFAGSFFLRGNVDINYTMEDYNKINEIFAPNNPIVVIYDNNDEEEIGELTEQWKGNSFVNGINAYSTTLGKELNYQELSDATGMDKTLVAQMYYYYFNETGEASETKISLGNFIQFMKEDVATNQQFASFFTEDTLAQLNMLDSGSSGQTQLSSEEFVAYSGMDSNVVQQIYGYYFSIYGQAEDGKIALDDLVQFLITNVATDQQFASVFTEDDMAKLNALSQGASSVDMEQELSSGEFATYFNMDETIAQQLYNYYAIVHGQVPQGKIALYDFIGFITDDVATDPQFEQYFDQDILSELDEAQAQMDDGLKQLVGNGYSRLIINTNLSNESDETFGFLENLDHEMDSSLSSEYYIVGNSAMAYEMSQSFPNEMIFITILTVIAIFIVVAIAFKSFSIPLILVSLIQFAVFVTMGIAYIQGSSIYYLPFLIVQCLLLGATVDYGILFTSYYREARNSLDKRAAVTAALNNSIHTILTSALILIMVTGFLGFLLAKSDPAISDILLIIARGGLCTTIMVVFILPGLMSALDRFVVRKKVQE